MATSRGKIRVQVETLRMPLSEKISNSLQLRSGSFPRVALAWHFLDDRSVMDSARATPIPILR